MSWKIFPRIPSGVRLSYKIRLTASELGARDHKLLKSFAFLSITPRLPRELLNGTSPRVSSHSWPKTALSNKPKGGAFTQSARRLVD